MTDSLPANRSSWSNLDGPRAARPEDIPAIVALANQVFRPAPRPGHMGKEFPVLLSEANAGNLLIFRDGGRVVSHVGVLRQTIRTCGVDLPAACIGAVCTDPEYRKAGLAGQLMDMAIRRSSEAGDVLMPISGKRTLYVSRGATSLGPQIRLKVPLSGIPSSGPRVSAEADAYTVCLCEPADWPSIAALQAAEAVRYAWTDREPILFDGFLRMGGVCLLARRKGGDPAAALLLSASHPTYGGSVDGGRVVQFAGDSRAIPALLAHAAAHCGMKEVDWPVLVPAAPAVVSMLLALGGTGKAEITGHTIVILNLAGLVERLGPFLARTGLELAARHGRLTVAAEGRSITLSQPDLQVELLFRGPATWSPPLLEMPAPLRAACSVALPVPLPDYGINYV